MPFIFTPRSDTFLQKSNQDMLPLFRRRVSKNQDTIPLFRRRVSKKSKILFRIRVSIKSRYATTLPQKSQQKIKIRFHSSAEESVKSQDRLPLFRRRVSKSQDTLPLFRRRVSLSSRGLTHIPPKNIYFMGLTHTPPI